MMLLDIQFNPELLGQRIQKYRQAKNLSQEGLADKCGLAQTYISKLERGHERSLSLDALGKLASALNVSMDQLLVDSLRAYQEDKVAAGLRSLKATLRSGSEKQLALFYEVAKAYLERE